MNLVRAGSALCMFLIVGCGGSSGICDGDFVLIYRDGDGDGHHGSASMYCDADPLPTGYVLTTEGEDFDDADPRAWTQAAAMYCGDADRDGYFDGCDAYPNGEDCDDDVGYIHPGALDTVGEDFDCNPTTTVVVDDAHGVFVSTAGSDTDPCGTAADPCATFDKAEEILSGASAGDRTYIFAATGLYTSQATVTHSVFGGFTNNAGVWTRADLSDQANLSRFDVPFVTSSTVNLTVTGDGLVIDGVGLPVSAQPGNNCQGIAVNDGGGTAGVLFVNNYLLVNCSGAANLDGLAWNTRGTIARSTIAVVSNGFATTNTSSLAVNATGPLLIEDSAITADEPSTNRYAVSHNGNGHPLTVRNSAITLENAGGNAYGIFAFGADVLVDGLELRSEVTTSGVEIEASNPEDATYTLTVLGSYLRSFQRAVRLGAFQTGEARAFVLGSVLSSSSNYVIELGGSTNQQTSAVVVGSVVESTGIANVLSARLNTGSATFVDSVLRQEAAGAVAIDVSNASPVRLLATAFQIDDTSCFVNLEEAAACADGASLDDCSTWTHPSACTESTGNVDVPEATALFQTTGTGFFAAFHHAAASPLIDAGIDPRVVLPFDESFDIDGETRPLGSAWDIGLDEQ